MGLWLKMTNGEVVEINTDGLAEAPEDGKQYARKDAAWAEVEDTDIEDAPEDGKQYARQDAAWSEVEAAEVLRGDPNNPPADWATDQLLYDGIEDDGSSGGSGSGGGPHNHDEYALVEHDHDEFTHDHDYLPLSGGTLTGDLTVDGVTSTTGLIARANGSSSPTNPNIIFGDVGVNAQTGFYRNSTGAIQVACEGEPVARFGLEKLQLYNDLQIDGLIIGQLGPVPADFWAATTNGVVFSGHGLIGGSQGSYRQSMTCNGFRNTDNKWTSIGTGGNVGATVMELTPNGGFHILVASNYPTGSASNPPIRFQVTETTTTVSNTFNPAGGTTFGITEGIDTRDVLERAETATMPAIDEEGVATADVKGVMLNDVVTALLLKVKELSARIEELEGA